MNKQQLLKRLEELYNERDAQENFPTRESCISWSNKVAPLLKFNNKYYENFTHNSFLINLKLSGDAIQSAIRVVKSQVEMAIEELKAEIENEGSQMQNIKDELVLPDKVTLSWLFRHVPCKFWWWLLGLFVVVFILGIRIGQTTFIREIMGYSISGGSVNGQSKLSAQEQYAKLSESGKQLLLEAFNAQTVDLKNFAATRSLKLPELRSQAVILASEYGWVTIKDNSINLTEKRA